MSAKRPRPGNVTVELTDLEASFLAFLAGHYVALLHKQGLDVQGKTKRSAKRIAKGIVGKLDKAAHMTRLLGMLESVKTERAKRERKVGR